MTQECNGKIVGERHDKCKYNRGRCVGLENCQIVIDRDRIIKEQQS